MARILVVDDEPMNRELVRAYLEGPEHSIIEAESGEAALLMAAQSEPDIVLLDVMMPGMNGFEATRRLKEQAREQYLPIILITALHDSPSRVLGLKMGADEFLTKPVDRQELSIRVHNLLALRASKQALLEENIQHAELHRLKDELTSMIVHDIKNPLAAIASNLQYVLQEPGGIAADSLQALEDAVAASKRVLDLAGNLLEVARMEGGLLDLRRRPVPLQEIVSVALTPRMMNARLRDVSLSQVVEQDIMVEVDRDLIVRVLENIIDNALRHTDTGGRIELLGRGATSVEIRIGNTGRPIPSSLRQHVFEKFARGPTSGPMNQGLGLYFCRLAVEAHGGRIWIEETPQLPTIFAFQLPLPS